MNAMSGLGLAVVGLLLVSIAAVVGVALRPEITAARSGKAIAFFAFFLLPLLGTGFALSSHLERSKSTAFCLSCHVMKPYGESLRIDDEAFVPAAHFQNRRIPREQACYTCHTDYAMFGGVRAKIRGLRHLYITYLGTMPKKIELYDPYRNRECLHCHAGARAYEESEGHEGMLAEMAAEKTSCLECHGDVHDVANLAAHAVWKEAKP